MTLQELARDLYETYGSVAGWTAHTGRPMPQWDELPQKIHTSWEGVAARARQVFVEEAVSLITESGMRHAGRHAIAEHVAEYMSGKGGGE